MELIDLFGPLFPGSASHELIFGTKPEVTETITTSKKIYHVTQKQETVGGFQQELGKGIGGGFEAWGEGIGYGYGQIATGIGQNVVPLTLLMAGVMLLGKKF